MSKQSTDQAEVGGTDLQRLDTRHYPHHARLQVLEKLINGGAMRTRTQASIRQLDADNQNVNIWELLAGDRCNFLRLKSSGYCIEPADDSGHDARSDMIMLSMVEKGHVEANNRFGSVSLGPGDIYITATSDFRNNISDSNIARFMFSSRSLKELSGRSGEFVVVREGSFVSEVLKSAVYSLEEALRENSPNQTLVSRMATGLVSRVIEEHISNSSTGRFGIIRERALQYIHENLTNAELSANEIAEYACTSRSNLYRAFKLLGGVSTYITNTRVELAHSMIGGSHDRRDLSQIAFICGFSSSSQLSSAYKRRFGRSPAKGQRRDDAAKPDKA